jgi:aerobic carbon-monoxide dehydrogenase medium subunit|tara:strand:+ start:1506 stop:2321 length:816 start_codon:yes stop_codon:yes gene_type:complete
MYAINYHLPKTLDQATNIFTTSEDPSFLSGGHTLIPTMKNRLAAPSDLIDLRQIPELRTIRMENGHLVIGGAQTHAEVAASELIYKTIPALALLAGSIGDVQVRHIGTIGGSVANNDPAADYPAAVLSLGARIKTSKRSITADDFFTGLYDTALEPGEIIIEIAFPIPTSAGYAKHRNPASRYALAAVFISNFDNIAIRVAVTGASENGVFRWLDAESKLSGMFNFAAIHDIQADPNIMAEDMHACRAYRASLVEAMTKRAVKNMGGVAIS